MLQHKNALSMFMQDRYDLLKHEKLKKTNSAQRKLDLLKKVKSFYFCPARITETALTRYVDAIENQNRFQVGGIRLPDLTTACERIGMTVSEAAEYVFLGTKYFLDSDKELRNEELEELGEETEEFEESRNGASNMLEDEISEKPQRGQRGKKASQRFSDKLTKATTITRATKNHGSISSRYSYQIGNNKSMDEETIVLKRNIVPKPKMPVVAEKIIEENDEEKVLDELVNEDDEAAFEFLQSKERKKQEEKEQLEKLAGVFGPVLAPFRYSTKFVYHVYYIWHEYKTKSRFPFEGTIPDLAWLKLYQLTYDPEDRLQMSVTGTQLSKRLGGDTFLMDFIIRNVPGNEGAAPMLGLKRYGEFASMSIKNFFGILGLIENCNDRLKSYEYSLHTVRDNVAKEHSQFKTKYASIIERRTADVVEVETRLVNIIQVLEDKSLAGKRKSADAIRNLLGICLATNQPSMPELMGIFKPEVVLLMRHVVKIHKLSLEPNTPPELIRKHEDALKYNIFRVRFNKNHGGPMEVIMRSLEAGPSVMRAIYGDAVYRYIENLRNVAGALGFQPEQRYIEELALMKLYTPKQFDGLRWRVPGDLVNKLELEELEMFNNMSAMDCIETVEQIEADEKDPDSGFVDVSKQPGVVTEDRNNLMNFATMTISNLNNKETEMHLIEGMRGEVQKRFKKFYSTGVKLEDGDGFEFDTWLTNNMNLVELNKAIKDPPVLPKEAGYKTIPKNVKYNKAVKVDTSMTVFHLERFAEAQINQRAVFEENISEFTEIAEDYLTALYPITDIPNSISPRLITLQEPNDIKVSYCVQANIYMDSTYSAYAARSAEISHFENHVCLEDEVVAQQNGLTFNTRSENLADRRMTFRPQLDTRFLYIQCFTRDELKLIFTDDSFASIFTMPREYIADFRQRIALGISAKSYHLLWWIARSVRVEKSLDAGWFGFSFQYQEDEYKGEASSHFGSLPSLIMMISDLIESTPFVIDSVLKGIPELKGIFTADMLHKLRVIRSNIRRMLCAFLKSVMTFILVYYPKLPDIVSMLSLAGEAFGVVLDPDEGLIIYNKYDPASVVMERPLVTDYTTMFDEVVTLVSEENAGTREVRSSSVRKTQKLAAKIVKLPTISPIAETKRRVTENIKRLIAHKLKPKQDYLNAAGVAKDHKDALESDLPYGIFGSHYEGYTEA